MIDGQFRSTTWHGEPSFVIDRPDIYLVVLIRGAKIASLRPGVTGREWLVQPTVSPLPPVTFGDEFTSAEMCGWDEMAPTVVPTRWGAVDLPDHGEVWAVPWEASVDGPVLRTRVVGRGIPFELARAISVGSRGSVRLDYTARLCADEPAAFLWAAHPQFRVGTGMALRCRADVQESVVSHGVAAPAARRPDDGDALHDLARGESRKRWLRVAGGSAEVVLRDRRSGETLVLSWLPAQLPYVGLWEDHCDYSSEPVVAVEPSNGWYDNLALARADGRCLVLRPGEVQRWSVTVVVGSGAEV